MANVYIKTVNGGENTSPAATDAIELDDGSTSKWTLLSAVRTLFKTTYDALYVALTGDQTVAGVKTFSSFPITPSSAPTTDYQVANKKYITDNAIFLAGDQSVAGVKTFSSFPVTPSSAPTTDYQVANKKFVADSTTAAAGNHNNLLINGGFDYFQRLPVPATALAMTDDVYNAPDRWYSLVQGANPTIAQNAGIGTSKYSCKLVAGGTTNRYGIAQIVESVNSIPIRGQTVTAQVRIKPVNNAGSGTRKYRIAILEWTGTADTVTSELVADWASATFTTSGFFASTTKTVVGCETATATHNEETVLSVSGAVSTSCNNLIVFVWTEDAPTHASDYVLIGEAGLFVSANAVTWLPRLAAEELSLCQRYFEKFGGEPSARSFASQFYQSAGATISATVVFATTKFYIPTGTVVGTWTVGNCGQPFVNYIGRAGVVLSATASGTGNTYFVDNTDGSAYFTAECEL